MGYPQRREQFSGRENLSDRQPRPAPHPGKERVRLTGAVVEEESGFARRQELEKLPLNDREKSILIRMGELPDDTIADPKARAETQEKRRLENAPPREEDFIIDLENNPSGIFTPRKIAQSKEWIKTRQQRSPDQLATYRGMILEYIFRKNIEINDWGGQNVVTSRTVPYDDMRNFTDFVEIWPEENGLKAMCGVDMTTSESPQKIEKKLRLIEEDLISGRMSKLDYFIDTADLESETRDGETEWQGKKVGYVERFPRVIIALGKENTQALVNDQVHDWELRKKNEAIREYNRQHPDNPKKLEKQIMPTSMAQIHYLEQHRDQLYWQAEVCLKTVFDTVNARYSEVFTGADARADSVLTQELRELLAEAAKLRYDETQITKVMDYFHQMNLHQQLKAIRREGNRRPDLSNNKTLNYREVDLNEQLENLDMIMKVLGIINGILHKKTYSDAGAEGSLGLSPEQIDDPRRQKNIIRQTIRRYLSDFDVPHILKNRVQAAA